MRDAYEHTDRLYDENHYIDLWLKNLGSSPVQQNNTWDEERIDIIGQNGNEGLHYTQSVEYYPPGAIKHPNYYDIGGIEVIAYIKAKLTPEQYKGYLLGNIYKYSGRMQYKGEYHKDVNKLAEYTTWLKELDANNA